MRETTTRILVGAVAALVGIGAFVLEDFNVPAMRWLVVIIMAGMIVELLLCFRKKMIRAKNNNMYYLLFGVCYLLIAMVAGYYVAAKPYVILLLLLIIVSADIGAWFFGQKIGGDKMWERLSPGKTWAGQIAGIICGTIAALLYGFIGTAIAGGHFDYGQFMPQLMWIGISVALLSQYGDLTASWLKRKLGIKDFSNLLPGHGGLLDRFDGWIYVLPIVWLITI